MNARELVQAVKKLPSKTQTKTPLPDKQKPQGFKFIYMAEQNMLEAARLFTLSFIQLNPMWEKLGATYEQVYSVNIGRVIYSAQRGWFCGMIQTSTKQLGAVSCCVDLVDYLKMKTMPNNSQFFKRLQKYAVQLEREYFKELNPKRGDAIYNIGSAIKPKYFKGGISKKFWSVGLANAKITGFKFAYARASNVMTTKLLTDFGGIIVKTVTINQQEIQDYKLDLIRIDLTQLTFDTVGRFYQQRIQVDEYGL